jgi:hypothetical protein
MSATGRRGEIPPEVWHALRVRRCSAPGRSLRRTTREGPEALCCASVRARRRLHLVPQRSPGDAGEERRTCAEEQVAP